MPGGVMSVTNRKSIAWAIVTTAALVSTTMMSYRFADAYSSSAIHDVVRTRAVHSADGSGPLAITPALDAARGATATMDDAGGTLSVTGANGTKFTLTVPQDALVSEEEITMTPVAAIPDLPFSQGLSSGGAVQLGPEGLLLVEPAALTVQLASPISIDQQCPFAWYKAGEDFQLFPLTLDLNAVEIDVDHFNGYGIAGGSSSDRDAVAAHSPDRSEARFTQGLEQATDDLRQKLSQNLTKKQAKKATKKFSSQIAQEFDDELAELDKQLGKDLGSSASVASKSRPQDRAPSPPALRCDLLNILVRLINLKNHGLTIADLGAISDQGLAAHITTAPNDLVLDAGARCQEGNIGEIGTLLGLSRFALMFAALDPSLAGLSKVATNINDTATQCAPLKLTFDSTITQVPTLGVAVRVQINLEATDVRLTAHVSRLGDGELFYFADAPLMHHIDTITNGVANPCSISNSSKDSTLKIISLTFKIHLRFVECPGKDAMPPTDLELIVDTGQPLENFTMTCPPPAGSFSTPGDTDIWRAQFYCEHNLGTSNHAATVFRFTNWDMGQAVPGNLATKLFQNVIPAVCPAYEEFTVIKVNRAD